MHLNQQAPLRIFRDASGDVRVHSIFRTIQGEGPYAGQAAVFVRLFGCNLQCPGCDTDYTSTNEMMRPAQVRAAIDALTLTDLVVITGGEPFRQNVVPLVRMLLGSAYRVQVETNGLFHPGNDFPFAGYGSDDEGATIVCSPKTARINPRLATMVDAYKYVLRAGDVDPEDGLPTIALAHVAGADGGHVARPPAAWRGPIYLQPMDEQDEERNAANVQACVHSVLNYPGLTLGFQMHKQVQLP